MLQAIHRTLVEGLRQQVLLYSTSHDSGETWADPAEVPVRHAADDNFAAGARPAWGPVLHWDAPTDRVLVFYSVSRECSRPGLTLDDVLTHFFPSKCHMDATLEFADPAPFSSQLEPLSPNFIPLIRCSKTLTLS